MAIIFAIPVSRRSQKQVSASFTVPAGTGQVSVILDIDPTDFLDPTLAADFALYEFVNDTWRHVVGAHWKGGGDPANPDQFPVSMFFPLSRVAGRTVRVEWTPSRSMRAGLTLRID